MLLSQDVYFSAAHRLHNPRLSDEENGKLFGPCNWIHSHGHNYKGFSLILNKLATSFMSSNHLTNGLLRTVLMITVTLRGKVDPMSGMFCNVLKFENDIKAVIQPLDHKNIDVDIPWFKERISTMENISIYIWDKMKETMKDPDLLFEVAVQEREGSSCSYRGE